MSAQTKIQPKKIQIPAKKMTFEQFMDWYETVEGRWELVDGVPYAMAPERVHPILISPPPGLTLNTDDLFR